MSKSNYSDEVELGIVAAKHEIIPNLWLGSHPSSIHDMKYVFALNGRPTYHVAIGQMVVCQPFDDAEYMPKIEMIHTLAKMVLDCIKKGPTLVHCTAGINRSALIVALALIYQGKKPLDAIALIRSTRSEICLSNKTFERWLLDKAEIESWMKK